MPTSEFLFKAMADGTRQRLLQVLSREALSVGELVEVLGQPQSTISRHLKVLAEAGLIVDRRAGTTTLYGARPRSGWDTGPGDRAESAPAGNGNGPLRDQLLIWAEQSIEEDLTTRLRRVLTLRDAETDGFFDSIGSLWDQLRIEAFGEVFHLEALTALLPDHWVVADLGTGTGYLLEVLASHFQRVIAVDASPRMLQIARARPELKKARHVQFREGSLADLPIESNEVDLAIAALVLHHVERPEAALAELARCVKPGGRAMIIEQEAHQHATFHERMGDHWWGFEPGKLSRWLRRAGFDDVQTHKLTTARPTGRSVREVPGLFVATARIPDHR